MMEVVHRCAYCKAPCDGTKHDVYGEYVLRHTIIICDECSEEFENEPGPWSDWGD